LTIRQIPKSHVTNKRLQGETLSPKTIGFRGVCKRVGLACEDMAEQNQKKKKERKKERGKELINAVLSPT
jgi:hypothetical protein